MRDSRRFAWMLIGLLVIGLGAAGCQTTTEPAEPVEVAEPPPPSDEAVERVKPKDAVVRIEAYYPLNEGHKFIAEYLEEVADRHPDKISLKIVDFRTPEGRTEWLDTGLKCAGVFVNGSTSRRGRIRTGCTGSPACRSATTTNWSPSQRTMSLIFPLGRRLTLRRIVPLSRPISV